MTTYVALLRAVNVGGTGKLAMSDLKALCAELGFERIRTYIASGNVVFDSGFSAAEVRARLEKRLLAYSGKTVGTFLRTAAEMRAVLKDSPFSDRESRLTYAFFMHERPASDALDQMRGRNGEEIRIGRREIYVFYPTGMGQSRLQIPAARLGTARNLRTIAKLVEMTF